jgi:predicted ATP-binding protein involved in virulence
MRVTALTVTNHRAIKSAEFRFQPGFNLIVGVNGVGKTSVLQALGVCLSAFVKQSTTLRTQVESFGVDDIRIGTGALTVECDVRIGKADYAYLVHKPREKSVPQSKKAGMPREQVHSTPEKAEFIGTIPTVATGNESEGRPLALLFSTNRAVPSDRSPTKGSASGGIAAAYAEAFSNRELRLAEFAAWMRVQEAMKSERPSAKHLLSAFEKTVKRFLPGYLKLRVENDGRPVLKINRGKTPLEVRQLSDGERGTLALVLDLTRRLAQANPEMDDPAKKAEAVVLIDEIDLHLHPKWQRQIVPNLAAAFPRCQFIATTHSPQIVAAVEPEQVLLLTTTGVVRAERTLGMDSNWILRHLMEADDRPAGATKHIQSVEVLIKKGAFEKARAAISQAKKKGLDLPEWSVLEARMARLEVLAR